MRILLLIFSAIVSMSVFSGVSDEERYRIMGLESDFPAAMSAVWKDYEEKNETIGNETRRGSIRREHLIAREAVGIESNMILWASQKMTAYYRMEIFKKRMAEILNKKLEKYRKGFRVNRDLEVRIPMIPHGFRKLFYDKFLDSSEGQKLIEEIGTMNITEEEFVEWFISRESSHIHSAFNRNTPLKPMSFKEKVNWIYRYATISSENRKLNKKTMMKRRANGNTKILTNEAGKPPIKPFRATDRNTRRDRGKSVIRKVKPQKAK